MSNPIHEQLARRLIDLGWRSTADTQWRQLESALPDLRALLGADDAFRDVCIAAALPAALQQCACKGEWEDATVARRCIELADQVVAVRNRA